MKHLITIVVLLLVTSVQAFDYLDDSREFDWLDDSREAGRQQIERMNAESERWQRHRDQRDRWEQQERDNARFQDQLDRQKREQQRKSSPKSPFSNLKWLY